MKNSDTYQESHSPNYKKTFRNTSFQFWGCYHPVSQTLWPRFVYKGERFGNWFCELRNFPYFSADVTVEGKVQYTVNDSEFISNTGDLLLAPPNCSKRTFSLNGTVARRIGFELYGKSLGSMLDNLQINQPLNLHLRNPAWLTDRIEHLYCLLSKRQEGTESHISSVCYELLACISQEHILKSEPPFPVLLDNVLRAIHSDVAANFSCAELAERSHCSEPTLYRLFHEYLHTTPQNYITMYKMDQAKQMLQLGQFSVKEVSKNLGYKDPFYFSRVYKKIQGSAPSKTP